MKNPARKTNLAWRPIANEMVIIDLDGNRSFHQLNDVGTFIWGLCDGKHSVEAIEQKLMEEFEVSNENAKDDLGEFIQELTELHLLS